MTEALELDGIYQHVKGRMALMDLRLRLAEGDWLLVVGPNGAGKSLLVRLILGLDRPSAGVVRVLGKDLERLDGRAMQRLRHQTGAVLQGGSLLASATVLENLLLPLRDTAMTRKDMARAARLVMTLLQLDGLDNHPPRALSLGQQRQVELARALIHQPRLLIWDGLSDGLDLTAIRETLERLGKLRENRKLTLIATDNRPEILAEARHRVAVLDRGRLLFEGPATDLAAASASRLELRSALWGQP
ncbi:ABC transporter ATP-binding protein [uncultured Thiocystis sp.]|jgi:ABC-type methionine transport system ATPase subunit|uniref:ATP-binding cassette domain-containing protein n=1 Tax=uncultured Thiocystis sp. TaxID=1202134 RepID=UPI0025CD5DF0|nr:ABC transporter ATP-binding protein [uncultured Thiocystis sp.]